MTLCLTGTHTVPFPWVGEAQPRTLRIRTVAAAEHGGGGLTETGQCSGCEAGWRPRATAQQLLSHSTKQDCDSDGLPRTLNLSQARWQYKELQHQHNHSPNFKFQQRIINRVLGREEASPLWTQRSTLCFPEHSVVSKQQHVYLFHMAWSGSCGIWKAPLQTTSEAC